MARSLLRRPVLRAYLAALLLTMTANAMAPVVLAFAVLDLTGSAADLGLVLAARTAPQLALLLAGGCSPTGFRGMWC